MQTDDGRLVILAGASRCGKTAYAAKMVKAMRRVLVWDIEAQWCELPGFEKITTRRGLLEAIKKPGAARLAYVAGGDIKAEFDFWAGCAMYWGRYMGGCVLVAEELADVTTPSKAPGNWGILVRRGLKRGISIYAISQRWAEADKTCIGNASEFVCFRISSGDDIAYMSRKTRIPTESLEGLEDLEYIKFDPKKSGVERGKLTFPRKK